ncbi:MAG: nitrate ABC transporter substrate-binding protein [Hyphomicrobiales bacterium]|nr:nitrate ABC transporter substrate-binding protein [Hyphomicrobiales bacterium]
MNLVKRGAFALLSSAVLAAPTTSLAEVGFGKPGEKVDLVVGYQPYYTESWSGVVINGKELWKKYLPKGSTAKFEIGLQGSVIVGKLLGEKNHLGYMGDMPAIVSTTKYKKVDIRIVAVLGTSRQQCNVFLVKNDAPQFKNGMEAVKWMDGKLVAAPKGACTDRFGRWAFEQAGIKPKKYLNMNIEVITSSFKNNKLDAAVIWEPTASKIQRAGIARRAASGESFEGIEGGDAGFLVMLNELVQTRPDIHKGWLEAELDAQLFLADLKNANDVARMADEQTEGIPRKTLWASLYGKNPRAIGGGPNKVTYDFVVNEKVEGLIKAATKFLHEQKVVPSETLRQEAVMDQVARQVMEARGLKSPIGFAKEQDASAYKE